MLNDFCSLCSPSNLMNRRWQCEDGDGDQSGAGAGDANVQHQTQPTGTDSCSYIFKKTWKSLI